MNKYSIEVAVFLSIIVLIILNFIGFGGIFGIIVMGFVATYLTVPEKSSYKVGGIAAFIFCILSFLFAFFTPPSLPYKLPAYSTGLGLAASSLINLICGFIMAAMAYIILGSFGGLIAGLLSPKKKSKPKYRKPEHKRRTLNRVS